VHYDLLVDVDLVSGTTSGRVEVALDLDAPVEVLRLHAVDLQVVSATVRSPLTPAATGVVTAYPDDEQIVVDTGSTIGPGPVVLELEWTGALSDQLVGLYRSTFTEVDEHGSEHVRSLAVTQFESTHARRAFPCFDEPALKATFSTSVVADGSHLVVTNAAETGRTPLADGRVRVDFARTMPLSTYLVAIVVGPLEVSEAPPDLRRRSRVPLRIVHRPGRGHLCEFAFRVAAAAIDFLEDYYAQPYPGDKVDLVAVPDFAFGAMENLGCVTFREVLLLIDPDDATQADLQRVADVVNHELAHMWFGDLVTMRWWNGLWLNEAFATFMEVAASDAFRPEWDCWTGFGLLRAAAFDTDSLASTRPIEYPVRTPADAEGMFDVLTYEKGASVVRMLERYLGPERFRDGIRAYLLQHRFGNTETTDLWDALEAATGEPVRRTMDAWVFRGGHPEVLVEPTDRGVRLDQRRATAGPKGPDEPPWPVPMVVTSSVDGAIRTDRVLLEEPVELDLGGRPDWVQPNTGGDGFHRTRMTTDAAVRLAREDRPALERFVLLDDAWAGLLAGHTPAADLLELVAVAAPRTDDPPVWRRVAGVLDDLVRLAPPDLAGRTAELARRLAVDRLDEIARTSRDESGRDDDGTEDERVRTVRAVAFALAGGTGADPAVRAEARRRFELGQGDTALRSAALDVVARVATRDEHREIERRWRNADTPQDQLRHLHHLADTPEADDLRRTLELALGEVRAQDRPYLLRRALQHPSLGALVWDEVESRWSEVVAGCSASGLARMLEGITRCTDRQLAGRIESFLAGERPEGTGRTVDQHVERMWVSVTVAERLGAD
jgi:puromycin-sensitive aminopeptidase